LVLPDRSTFERVKQGRTRYESEVTYRTQSSNGMDWLVQGGTAATPPLTTKWTSIAAPRTPSDESSGGSQGVVTTVDKTVQVLQDGREVENAPLFLY